jgi:dephospho-CoA kinase
MITIGLTGNIGSGKSAVAALFREAKVPTIDTDALARQAIRPGTPTLKKLHRQFGPQYFRRSDGALLRKKIAQLIFEHPPARQKINQIIHPAVIRLLSERLKSHSRRKTPCVVVEVPLLFEAGLQELFDYVCLVVTSKKTQSERLLKRGMTRGEIQKRLQSQMGPEQKEKKSHFVIQNSGTKTQTRQQVKKIMTRLTLLRP